MFAKVKMPQNLSVGLSWYSIKDTEGVYKVFNDTLYTDVRIVVLRGLTQPLYVGNSKIEPAYKDIWDCMLYQRTEETLAIEFAVRI